MWIESMKSLPFAVAFCLKVLWRKSNSAWRLSWEKMAFALVLRWIARVGR
jgi:hypothetical protein